MDLSKIKAKAVYGDVSFVDIDGNVMFFAELCLSGYIGTVRDEREIANRLVACWNNFQGYQTVNPPVETEDAP